MKKRFALGQVGRLKLTADGTAVAGALGLWAFFGLLGRYAFRLRPGAAVGGGLVATALHFVSELWHQAGHARAAERTGYPMEGVHLWGVLGMSVYPRDEPELPAQVHIERALGGPRASAPLAILGAILAFIVRPHSRLGLMISGLFALENALVFTAGALTPMPLIETDGVTLRHYLHSHRRRNLILQE